jgi:addiction module HigA family antidote
VSDIGSIRGFAPATPGQLLVRGIGKARDKISQKKLAEALGVSRFTVNQIIRGHRAVTADMAVRLEYVLGTSAEFWLEAQMHLDLHKAREAAKSILPGLTQLREAQIDPPA